MTVVEIARPTEVLGRHDSVTGSPDSESRIPFVRKTSGHYYPPDIAHDLDGIDLPLKQKEQVLATAWEYSRSVIPSFTNWSRYVAFMRIIIMGIIAEYRGTLIDLVAGDKVLNFDMNDILSALFGGTRGHEAMSREYRNFVLISAEKTSDRKEGELFRRYVNALAYSPQQWFRIRDADDLARFTIAAALACNDVNDVWFTDEQFDLLAELGDTQYDAISYFKHRSEGETNSTFAYMPSDLRVQAWQQYRNVLWALDVAWGRRPGYPVVINFLRIFGGPLHMMMQRYRFVEEGLTIGRQENKQVVDQTRQHFKLWNRLAATGLLPNTWSATSRSSR